MSLHRLSLARPSSILRHPFYVLRRRHCPSTRPRFYSSTSSTPSQRIDRVLSRLPKFLHPYTSALRTAPVSHVVSFLILHELTAIVPLVGLAVGFHFTEWLPRAFVEGKWLNEGVEKFGRYFGRKGWFGVERVGESEGGGVTEGGVWIASDSGRKILVEVATAYAITKVLLPARILFSVWATPWFARAVLKPMSRLFGRERIESTATMGKNMGKRQP